ncbi:eif4A (nucleomorph) [Hemiselmis andersenii]|uniref:RNA helicase n=1 Tax=Hemiselmis andersenii TaxID=464988 RepID=A9BKH3_HEMAN|nr:eif4A [Hemiselmis andersenii]ABW98006.1 eif4A [Hemiselmis andersenii]|mmetsp:Transcript_21160/g.48983  ORF Transcript_21160/g.48983 Transcript_21160/m.48983 type:complete len:402 (-) Transcript_21160:717-1922(-)
MEKEGSEKLNENDDEFFPEKIGEFSDMGLKKEILQGIFKYGFEKPSLIQQKGILPIIHKKDLIAQAQSGTGKTATFVIGTLQNVQYDVFQVQCMVVCPSRELANQIKIVYESIGKFTKIRTQECIGGTKIKDDRQLLFSKKPHIIIGTPGRLFDILSIEKLLSQKLEYLVIDEADEMFSRGFKVQIFRIFKYLPKECKIGLFSATLPKEILQVIELFISDPVRILVKKEELTLEGIKQFYIPIEKEEWKLEALFDIYRSIKAEQSIIYVNARKKVEWLANKMKLNDFSIAFIHGEMEQSERSETMKNFRFGKFRVLITTDLLSRGIDIEKVNFVINYDLPQYKESYIHRIGRSGRFGKKGVAINFLSRVDVDNLREIEAYYSTVIALIPEDFTDFDFTVNT